MAAALPLLAVGREIACEFRAVVLDSAQTALQFHVLPFYTVRPSQDYPARPGSPRKLTHYPPGSRLATGGGA